jgi:choline monooxygenase
MIDEDIRRAATLPAAFYRDPAWFARQQEQVFARSWQLCGDAGRVAEPGDLDPFTLLPGCLDEPLLFTRDARGVHCLSNVCTHRANLVVTERGCAQSLRCRYHGRRFSLDGRFQSMPEFEDAADFPQPRDDLPRVAHGALGRFLFASIAPTCDFDAFIAPLRPLLPAGPLTLDLESVRSYPVAAHWALYCDNYLEGFHIPYVHPALSTGLDYGAYRTELHEWGSVQVGIDTDGGVAASYVWLYPNTMFNIYRWGVSVNVVQPRSFDRTEVLFMSYVSDPSERGRGAGADLDRVEHEDEDVVERVQLGVRSRLYDRGRYSPSRETGVHHFHRLLAAAL